MTTALDIVTDALRIIKVVGISETPAASYASDGLTALNDMIFEWKLHGVDVSHAELGLSDTFALDPEYVKPTKFLLAQTLAVKYGFQPPNPIEVDNGWRVLQAAYWTEPTMALDAGLLKMPSQYSYGNTRETST